MKTPDSMLTIETKSLDETLALGYRLGSRLGGGEVIELISDVGGGKTSLVRGIAQGAESNDRVASPTFTISRIYYGKRVELHHFDFYRLEDPGIITQELEESIRNPAVTVLIEWSTLIESVLPQDRLQISIKPLSESARAYIFTALGPVHTKLLGGMQ